MCPTGLLSSAVSAQLLAPPCSPAPCSPHGTGSVCVVASYVGTRAAVPGAAAGAIAGASAGAGAGAGAAAAPSVDAALCMAAGDGPDLAGSMVPD